MELNHLLPDGPYRRCKRSQVHIPIRLICSSEMSWKEWALNIAQSPNKISLNKIDIAEQFPINYPQHNKGESGLIHYDLNKVFIK